MLQLVSVAFRVGDGYSHSSHVLVYTLALTSRHIVPTTTTTRVDGNARQAGKQSQAAVNVCRGVERPGVLEAA